MIACATAALSVAMAVICVACAIAAWITYLRR